MIDAAFHSGPNIVFVKILNFKLKKKPMIADAEEAAINGRNLRR